MIFKVTLSINHLRTSHGLYGGLPTKAARLKFRANEKFPLETIVGLVLELTQKVLFSLGKY